MLDPNTRSLYTGALRPPPGYVFDTGLAATYSLDLATLLSVPLHLALFAAERDGATSANGVALLESLQRTTSRLGVYCQQGRIHPPGSDHVLYGMLEPVIVEAEAPLGGAFHPKLWVLRFVGEGGEPLLRLLVLSRNITQDRSWDLSLVLEGRPRGRRRAENRELAKLVESLPELAARDVSEDLARQAASLGEELRRTDWEMPEGFDQVYFHVLGLRRRKWSLPESRRLAVISPFLADEALEKLAGTTKDPVALISRAEELAMLDGSTRDRFERRLVLDEAVETEDSARNEASPSLRGLHAKAYVAEIGWYTHLFTGSANATRPALVGGVNVELMAELVGKSSRVGSIDDLIGEGGLRDVLVPFTPPAEPPEPGKRDAERRAERLQEAVLDADLRLGCEREDDLWRLTLKPARPFALDDGVDLRAWPVTLPADRAVRTHRLARGEPVELPLCSLASVTGLIAFRLDFAEGESLRFVLNLPVEGLPEGRDSAWLRAIVSDREGFLRYLLLLLAEENVWSAGTSLPNGSGQLWDIGRNGGADGLPLLEQLTRALSRDPDRLRSIGDIVRKLGETEDGDEVLPPEFLTLWRVFEAAQRERNR